MSDASVLRAIARAIDAFECGDTSLEALQSSLDGNGNALDNATRHSSVPSAPEWEPLLPVEPIELDQLAEPCWN